MQLSEMLRDARRVCDLLSVHHGAQRPRRLSLQREERTVASLGRSEGQHLKAVGTQRQLRWAMEAVSAKARRLPAKK
jgi:hypothetical protein